MMDGLFDKKKMDLRVNMTGKEYVDYLKFERSLLPNKKNVVIFSFISVIVLLGVFLMVLIHASFAIPEYHQPFFEGVANIGWVGILKFLVICAGVAWIFHGVQARLFA